ncbi:MAG: double-stranded DNA-binding protein [Thaumarchaeota archaeon]|nr:double-stranded DNA-binding protein [Nitrososphaerota archaeon]
MTEEDKELELLKAKRLLEMQKNLSQKQKIDELKTQPTASVSPREIVVKQLGYRGLEVLENAETQFPVETKMVIEKLAELIRSGEVTEIIDGGKLLTLFRSIGIRVKVQTTIKVEQDGKLVSWSDKLKGEQDADGQDIPAENP